jgi:chromosome segregation ATPase
VKIEAGVARRRGERAVRNRLLLLDRAGDATLMMTEPMTQTPLAIDRVERARAKHDQVRLRLSGRWLTDALAEHQPTLLVVQLHGRRLRFPAGEDGGEDMPEAAAGAPFAASFTVPDWAVPEQPGQAVLWVGETVVPVPPPGMAASPPPLPTPPPAAAESGSASAPAAAREPADPAAGPAPAGSPSGRSGPLAQLLHKETVTALHAELEQRTAESARLRSALAAARSDLQGGSSARSDLELAHSELREELQRLMGVASDQRDEFEQRLADAVAERERLSGELAGSGEELAGVREAVARAETELAGVREELALASEELERVRDELVDATTEQGRSAERLVELREELVRAREAGEDRLASARSDFDQQLAAARSEAEAAIEAARAETEAMLAATRSHSDSRVTAAEAQVARLNQRLTELQDDERHRFEESARLREQLAASQISRDAALGEAEGLRAELDRLGTELAVVREQSGPPGGDLSEARQLLADARALTQRLRGDSAA